MSSFRKKANEQRNNYDLLFPQVEVGPFWQSKIVAYGPGLEGGVVNQPAVFTVETNGETGALGKSHTISSKW